MDDYEYDDATCPKCGTCPTHARQCTSIGCDDGWIDRYDEDPLWYDEDDPELCPECNGTGWEHWCPKCGYDFQHATYETEQDERP